MQKYIKYENYVKKINNYLIFSKNSTETLDEVI